MDKPKRQPTLADRVLSAPDEGNLFDKKFVAGIKESLFDAHRFVLDNQAAIYLGEAEREDPDAIYSNMEFAIPPFKRTWVELPARPHYTAVTLREPSSTSDGQLGYLFDGPAVYVFSAGIPRVTYEKEAWKESFDSSATGMSPLKYVLNVPMPITEKAMWAQRFKLSLLGIDAFFWGELFQRVHKDHMRLTDHHTMRELPLRQDTDSERMWKRHGPAMMEGNAGDMRTILAMLLLLNRTTDLRVEEILPPQQGMFKGKVRTLLSHRVVRFKLDPKPRLIRSYGTLGAPRREHEVKGHFCLDKKARDAKYGEHFWVEHSIRQWSCAHCNGKKWWRKEHRRGKNKDGLVLTEYSVTR